MLKDIILFDHSYVKEKIISSTIELIYFGNYFYAIKNIEYISTNILFVD